MSDLNCRSDPGYDSLCEDEKPSLYQSEDTQVCYIEPSRSIDHYTKMGSISEGSFGVVFRAQLKSSPQNVDNFAIKKLKGKYLTNKREGFSHSVLREIHILRRCNHKNIVRVVEVCVDSADDVYLVMEYVHTDVKSWQRSLSSTKNLDIAHIKNIIRQLLNGVSYLHRQSITHRDLKTSNLLLTTDGVLKICDFGLAREVPKDHTSWTPQVMTMLYRCPEVITRERTLYSKSIDMWSIGIIFAELVLGHPPFLRCMKEPLVPDSPEAELEMFKELAENLGTPTCLQSFSNNSYGKDIVQKSGLSAPSEGNLSDSLTSRLSKLGIDFLLSLLHWDPRQRPSALDALDHPFFAEEPAPFDNRELPDICCAKIMGN